MLRPVLTISRVLVIVFVATSPNIGLAINPKNNSKVFEAFRDVIRQPAKSTVQVYCDGYTSALGVIVRDDGCIVTKASELKGNVQVKLNSTKDAQKYDATIVGSDKFTDLAVLKINAKDLPVIAWSDAAAPPVGSWLATPGLESEIRPLAIGVLSVNPRKINAPPGALGILVAQVDDVLRIERVTENSPASQAGLLEGDVIRKVNGKAITGRQHGQETIRSYQPGDQVELTVERSGSELNVKVTLSNLNILMNGERADFQNKLGGRLSDRRSGFPMAIQHDSVLRPGDCGGPLVDLEGKAIGLNIARAGRVESYALPADVVRETVAKLLEAQRTPKADDMLVGKPTATEAEKKVH
jgi:serine protease Do